MDRFFSVAILLAAVLAAGQRYDGPPPSRPDIPYLVHADHLVETEAGLARRQSDRDEVTYIVPGGRSMSRTPLASPVLIVETAALDAAKLQLFRLEVSNGHRELRFDYKGKRGAMPFRTELTRISASLYQLEVLDTLAAGEYALSPDGANDVFCFEVF